MADSISFATVENSADGDTRFSVELHNRMLMSAKHFLAYAGCPLKVRRELTGALESFFSSFDGIVLVDATKWLLCYPLAKLTNEAIDEGFERQGALLNPFKVSRQVKAWFRSKLYRDRVGRNAHLWYTWFQLKRAAPCVPESFIVLSAEKHRKNMVSDRPVDDQSIEDREKALAVLTHCDLFRKLKREMSAQWDPLRHRHAPSTRACLTAGRHRTSGFLRRGRESVRGPEEGFVEEVGRGAWGQLVPAFQYDCLADLEVVDGVRLYGGVAARQVPATPLLELDRGDLKRVRIWEARDPERGRLFETKKFSYWAPEPRIQSVQGWTVEDGQLVQCPVFEIEPSKGVEEQWALWLIRESEDYMDAGPLEAETEFILEPLKVRTITKGPAAPYALAKEWQKTVHHLMRKERVFRLIGKTIEVSDVESIRTGEVDGVWHSIDYSSATDRLDAPLSEAIMHELTMGKERDHRDYEDEEARRIVRATLLPHRISYSCLRRMGASLASVQQTNGQLMGSPTSFPILCLVNYATILAADVEYFGPEVAKTLENLVLINGDDALAHRPHAWRVVHERIAKACGLGYSKGKAYSSNVYANMNSVGFYDEIPAGRISSLGPVPVLKLCTYYPIAGALGLAQKKGIGREQLDDYVEKPSPFEVVERVLETSLRPSWSLMTAIMPHLAETLSKESLWRNWFLPRAFGGMGLVPPSDFKWSVTEQQREHACWVWSRANGRLTPRPTPREEVVLEPSISVDAASEQLLVADGDVDWLPWGFDRVIIRDGRFLREPVGREAKRPKPRKIKPKDETEVIPLPKGWQRMHHLVWS